MCSGFWGLAWGGRGKPAWNRGMGVVVCDSRRERIKSFQYFDYSSDGIFGQFYLWQNFLSNKSERYQGGPKGGWSLVGNGMSFGYLAVTKRNKEGFVFVLCWRQLRRGNSKIRGGYSIWANLLKISSKKHKRLVSFVQYLCDGSQWWWWVEEWNGKDQWRIETGHVQPVTAAASLAVAHFLGETLPGLLLLLL